MQAGGVAIAGPPAKRKKAAEAKKLYARDTAQVRVGRNTCEPPCWVAGRARQRVDEREPRASKYTLGDLSRSSARAGGWLAARRKRGGRAQVTRRRRPHRAWPLPPGTPHMSAGRCSQARSRTCTRDACHRRGSRRRGTRRLTAPATTSRRPSTVHPTIQRPRQPATGHTARFAPEY